MEFLCVGGGGGGVVGGGWWGGGGGWLGGGWGGGGYNLVEVPNTGRIGALSSSQGETYLVPAVFVREEESISFSLMPGEKTNFFSVRLSLKIVSR